MRNESEPGPVPHRRIPGNHIGSVSGGNAPPGSARRENLRRVGSEGETVACRYLERAGFEILFRNWTARSAEIDVVARSPEGAVWFFEVKFRRSSTAWYAVEAFTPKKRRDFFRAVSLCCAKFGWHPDSVRTGLIAIDVRDGGYRVTRYSDLSPEGG